METEKKSGLGPDVDIATLRNAKSDGNTPRFWRSLDELADTPEFRDHAENEFPHGANDPNATLDRRELLKVMAASAAFAGLTGCTKLPTQHIVPYVRQPEQIIPGKPLFYATAVTLGGVASGILVESNMARPTKVEGNPDHPASLGATDAFAQASILGLYDPDRSQAEIHDGRIGSWTEFQNELSAALAGEKGSGGAGLRLLTPVITSPTLGAQIRALLKIFPSAKWHQYESVGHDNVHEGTKLAFGEMVNPVYRVDRAEVILSLDSDLLTCGPGSVRYAREFSRKRRVEDAESKMTRLYAVESTPTNTGAMADHRLRMRASEIESFARALAKELGLAVAPGPALTSSVPPEWIPALARDLKQHPGASLVVAGDHQPPIVHALAYTINQALGNFDQTIYFTQPIEESPVNQWQSIGELAADMRAGKVTTLLILGGNPAYDAPADLALRDLLPNVKFSARLGLYEDETSTLCHWHIPQAHSLESWGDARAYDGTISVIQPLIAPLYSGKSEIDFLAALNGQPGNPSHDIVREFWQAQQTGASGTGTTGFSAFWDKTLRDGVMADTAFPPKQVTLKSGIGSDSPAAVQQGLEIIFRPDPTIWDGRFSNNGWLQELPKPLTKLTWDSVAMLSPKTAQRLGLKSEDAVELKYQGRSIVAPAWVMPGHADESVTVFLGYGRTRAGRVGTGAGFDAGWIRSYSTPWIGSGLEIRKTGSKWALAATQTHSSMEGRELVRVATLDEYRKNPQFAQADAEKNPLSLYPEVKYEGNAWGMAIDLNACTGCGACVVACQAENNIAVVGKREVMIGREMHWIRIDRYFEGDLDDPRTYHEPVVCMHCEDAPCEVVCPVAATVHSPEGLNEMVYNRCVGTRYCSNNCPYKVRRFNFRLYSDWETPSLFGMRNPNVSVRSRGVMEKCTYCVQRINAVKIEAEKEDRTVRDGEIVTACQQSCPSEAIVFGNINDPESSVSKLKKKNLNFSLLEELNTRPRTTYQARLRNPNPEIEKAAAV
ncbi:MAG: quinol:cytochrome c oxidoreductase iron-sulfur protein precursor [Candidatus Acidoferrum typicum]|nr:quinol:cytochrome c oxidoreductase iron-sulfur protein precursor [Candidatus Acidoferrum typicum]